MKKSLRVVLPLVFALLIGFCQTAMAEPEHPVMMPHIDGPWWQVAGDPDLGDLTTKEQQPVDFAVWQAADGTWQLWSCIRRTKCGGKNRLFHGWEADNITDTNWRPRGIMMQADAKYGETPGGLQAPHVVKMDGTYYMLYGDWEHICLATSKDGKEFERYVPDSGKTGLFTEGQGTNTRDIVALKVGNLWHGYYTAFPNRQGADYCRTSTDLKHWSESTNVAFGGRAGVTPFSAECPHVVEHDGRYYLFRTQKYGEEARSCVYSSTDPMNFGLNQDRLYFVGEMPVAAMEIVHHEGQDYIAALLPSLKGIQIAKLGWKKPPQIDASVFDLTNPNERLQWKLLRGEIASVFTQSTRDRFGAPARHFIGTAETSEKGFDDKLTCVVQSPSFVVESPSMFAYVSGGIDPDRLYVALLDAGTRQELLRVVPAQQGNELEAIAVDTSKFVGRKVAVQVVDDSRDPWGHINFGGLYRAR